MQQRYSNIAIVIPCFEPTVTLIPYVRTLITQGFSHIYIVDDGSGIKYEFIFTELSHVPECHLLTHPQNQGKGAALKTAYQAIMQGFQTCQGVVTVDCDGQHAVADVCNLASALPTHPDCLLLGVRDFSSEGIPVKSYVGNRLSSAFFFVLYGKWVKDTQTGLRAFSARFLPKMCEIEGDRFAYEMAVLTTFATQKIPMKNIPIDTIYLQGNAGTHFKPLADSLQIFGVLLKRLGRFLLSSGVACVVDISLCWLLLCLFTGVISNDLLRIGLSVGIARLVSLCINYTLNKRFVFGANQTQRTSFARYLVLAFCNVLASTALIYIGAVVLGVNERLAKLVVDTILLCVNYQIQRLWVFPSIRKRKRA